MNKTLNKITEEMHKRHLERIRQRIKKEQQLYFENYKKEILNKPLVEGESVEGRKANRKRLLEYVHKYVFLQRLEPIDNTSVEVLQILKKDLNKKTYSKQLLDFRNIFTRLFRIKAIFIFASAFFFFFIEYFIHYHSSFSLNDINITFETIITKIPPFF